MEQLIKAILDCNSPEKNCFLNHLWIFYFLQLNKISLKKCIRAIYFSNTVQHGCKAFDREPNKTRYLRSYSDGKIKAVIFQRGRNFIPSKMSQNTNK